MKIIALGEKVPTQLDVDRILMKRRKSVSYEERLRYERLQAGVAGEQIVMDYLQEHGRNDWIILRNLWLEFFGICEADIVIFTNAGARLIEVKHYTDDFVYENSSCYVKGRKTKYNVVSQTEKAQSILKDICREIFPTIEVTGLLVFTGIDCEVDIRTPVNDITIKSRNQLKKHILEIKDIEMKQINRRPFDLNRLINHIGKYQIADPYNPTPLTQDEINPLRKGIYCDHCGSFDIEVSKKQYISCKCGFRESREEAVVRTICEYGVLTYDRGLTRGAVVDFLGGQVSHTYIFKMLNKHFERFSNHSATYYKNKKMPYHQIKDGFKIKLPRIQYLY